MWVFFCLPMRILVRITKSMPLFKSIVIVGKDVELSRSYPFLDSLSPKKLVYMSESDVVRTQG